MQRFISIIIIIVLVVVRPSGRPWIETSALLLEVFFSFEPFVFPFTRLSARLCNVTPCEAVGDRGSLGGVDVSRLDA